MQKMRELGFEIFYYEYEKMLLLKKNDVDGNPIEIIFRFDEFNCLELLSQ